MLTAGSVCINAEMKDMLNAASGNWVHSEGVGGGGVLWYWEVS